MQNAPRPQYPYYRDDLSPHVLSHTQRRWRCPTCQALVERLPNGRMRYHGSSCSTPRCAFPDEEWSILAQPGGAELLTIRHPHLAPAYVAIVERRASMPPKRPHGRPRKRPLGG